MDSLIQDLRYAVRTLLKSPGFTFVAVGVLALGIGLNVAVFSVVDAVLLRPLPFHDPGSLVVIPVRGASLDGQPGTRAMNLVDWRHQTQVLDEITDYMIGGANLAGGETPARLRVAVVAPNFFRTLGVNTRIGRAFRDDEGTSGNGSVVVLNHGLWRRRFGADPGIVGRSIFLNGRSYLVIGVMPAGFSFPEQRDVWIPRTTPWDGSRTDMFRLVLNQTVVGRLKRGLSLDQGRALGETAVQRWLAAHPAAQPRFSASQASFLPLQALLGRGAGARLHLALAAVGVVLLIACANVAGLSLARAMVREHELALRTALGAGLGRLSRQLLTESLVLTGGGVAGGLVLAVWGREALSFLVPQSLVGVVTLSLDARVLAFVFLLTAACAVLCGLSPAVVARRPSLTRALHSGARPVTARSARLRHALVTGQIALALVLVASATWLIEGLARLERTDPGFRADGVLTAELALPTARYPTIATRRAFYRELFARLRGSPGVTAAGGASALPLTHGEITLTKVGQLGETANDVATAGRLVVTSGYFAAMGIPLVAGRDLAATDDSAAPSVVVVSRSLARRVGLGGHAVGTQVRADMFGDSAVRTVVGVAGDVREWELSEDPLPAIYFPYAQHDASRLTLVVRGALQPTSLASEIRAAVRAVDPSLPVYNVRSMDQVTAESIAVHRGLTRVLLLFGALALLLAALGLYGTLAFTAAQRTREIGVRLALGAEPAEILVLVLREGAKTTTAGLLLGLAGAWSASRLLGHVLVGLSVADPLGLLASVAVLAAVAMLAAYLPARRATAVDPLVALRSE